VILESIFERYGHNNDRVGNNGLTQGHTIHKTQSVVSFFTDQLNNQKPTQFYEVT